MVEWLRTSTFITVLEKLKTIFGYASLTVAAVVVAWSQAHSARSAAATFVSEHPEGILNSFLAVVGGLVVAVAVLWGAWQSTAKELRKAGSRQLPVAGQIGPVLKGDDVEARLVPVKGYEHRLEIRSTSGEVRKLRWVLPLDKGEWHIPPTEATIQGQTVEYPLERLPLGVTLRVPAVARERVRALCIEIRWERGLPPNVEEHVLPGHLEPDTWR